MPFDVQIEGLRGKIRHLTRLSPGKPRGKAQTVRPKNRSFLDHLRGRFVWEVDGDVLYKSCIGPNLSEEELDCWKTRIS